jgi:hypothetical protein
MKQGDIFDAFDSYDREALRSAEMIRQLAGDVIELYSTGVEINDPSPGAIQYEQTGRSTDISDPTGNAATDPRRQQRHGQLRATRLALKASLRHLRHALYNSAAAAGP